MTTPVIEDTDAIYRRAWQIRGEESGVCLKATAQQMQCWYYRLGNPPFRCPDPPDDPTPPDAPLAAHDMRELTVLPWAGPRR